jgi:hypothetical protein
MSLTIQQWINSGIVPTTGLTAWHSADGVTGVADGGNVGTIPDNSGHSRDLTGVFPWNTLDADALNGKPSVVFSGIYNPLVYTGSVVGQHFFIVAAYQDAAFAAASGLLTDKTTYGIFFGSNGTTKFTDITAVAGASTTYKKNDTAFALSNMQAPMSGGIVLLEVNLQAAITMDGIQLGQLTTSAPDKWKGPWCETLIYSTSLSAAQRRAVLLYFAMKYGISTFSLPLYFPSDDMLSIRRRRFYAEPPDFEKVTNSYEYEDGGRTFNETADDAPRRWEYVYKLVNNGASTDPYEVKIFDEFFAMVRLSQTFNFTDKYGTVWDNVRIESYDRTHEAHKPWIQTIRFKLIRYPS